MLRSIVAALLLSVLLGFASLLVGIVSLVVAGIAGGARPDMSMAYRQIALPVALVSLPLVFIAHLIWERRNLARTSPRT